MGMIVDTNVFIHFEKSGKPIDLSPWESTERVYISAVPVSELLIGVHRANTEERKQRRSAFVEAVISGIGVLDFTINCARSIWTDNVEEFSRVSGLRVIPFVS